MLQYILFFPLPKIVAMHLAPYKIKNIYIYSRKITTILISLIVNKLGRLPVKSRISSFI